MLLVSGSLLAACSRKAARGPAVAARGKVLITDGPDAGTKEHIGGLLVLEAADLDAALAWGRKAAGACRAPVEVRPFWPLTEAPPATRCGCTEDPLSDQHREVALFRRRHRIA
jgi:hypothetical protein